MISKNERLGEACRLKQYPYLIIDYLSGLDTVQAAIEHWKATGDAGAACKFLQVYGREGYGMSTGVVESGCRFQVPPGSGYGWKGMDTVVSIGTVRRFIYKVR